LSEDQIREIKEWIVPGASGPEIGSIIAHKEPSLGKGCYLPGDLGIQGNSALLLSLHSA